jgi:hypothetical protein
MVLTHAGRSYCTSRDQSHFTLIDYWRSTHSPELRFVLASSECKSAAGVLALTNAQSDLLENWKGMQA